MARRIIVSLALLTSFTVLLACSGGWEEINSSPTSVDPSTLDFPKHEFRASSQPGQAKSQIRCIAPRGDWKEDQFRSVAYDLATKYHAASAKVAFFDDEAAINGWDGSGSLRDADWSRWLCDVTVETGDDGKLYVNEFSLAKDEETGQPRDDVLRQ